VPAAVIRMTSSTAAAQKRSHHMKVLLVDDDVDLLDLLSYALRRAGYAVVVAPDGEQAIRKWQAEHPDLVLLDIVLPRICGFEVCRRIRRQGRTPVILLT